MAKVIKILYIEHTEVITRNVLSGLLNVAVEEEDSNDGQTKLGHRQLHSHTYKMYKYKI